MLEGLHDAQKIYQDADHDSHYDGEDLPIHGNHYRIHAMDNHTHDNSDDSSNMYSHTLDNASNTLV
jgi:hypothetical protein